MSGPWDRPSQDREPPASEEDAAPERPEAGRAPGDAWPSNDLWSDQRSDARSGWDDWSTLRAPDDFVLDEPVSTLGDPWAESWADEASRDAPPRQAEEDRWSQEPMQPDRWSGEPSEPDRWSEEPSEPDRWSQPAPDAGWTADPPVEAASDGSPEAAPAAEPDHLAESAFVTEPAPAAEARPDVPVESDEPPWQHEPPTGAWDSSAAVEEPRVQAAEPSAPHVAPWQTSDDPWGAVIEREAPATREPEAPAAGSEPVAESQADEGGPDTVDGADVAVEAPDVVSPATDASDASDAAGATEETPTSGGWRRDLLPAWLTGRSASAAADAVPAEDAGEAGEGEPGVESLASGDLAGPVDADAPQGQPAAFVAEVDAQPEPEPESFVAEPESFVAEAQPEPEPESFVAEPESLVAEAEPRAEPDADEVQGDNLAFGRGEPEPSLAQAAGAEPETAWEDDLSADALASSQQAEDAAREAADGGTDAGQPDASPDTGTDAWPEADSVAAAGAVSPPEAGDVAALGIEEDRDRRFDAFIGASLAGAAVAPDLPGEAEEAALTEADGTAAQGDAAVAEAEQAVGEETGPEEVEEREEVAESEEVAEPAATVEPASVEPSETEPEPAPAITPEGAAETAGAQAVSEPSPSSDLADAAWVAEPAPWDQTPLEDAPPAAAVEATEPPEVEDPAETWRAAAAAAAAAATVRTPEIDAAPAATAGTGRGDVQPTWRPEWLPDVEEIEPDEHTSVLPTDWTPPPPTTSRADSGDLAPHATSARTRPASDVDRELDEEAEAATTAEQAVPWLIGFILLLAGMVIVLLALIFAGDGSLGGGSAGEPTPEPSLAGGLVNSPPPSSASPSAASSSTPVPSGSGAAASPSDQAVGGPTYGPIEMVYQGRSAALAPIYLLQREFTTEPEPEVLAQDPNLDVRRYGWAMDGTLGAGLYADLMVSVEPGVEKRQLAEEISAVTFGPTSDTVYAVRVGGEGANDTAVVLAVDFESGDASELARVTYPRPPADSRSPVRDAQFEDDGGPVRLFWMEDNQLRLWVLNGGMWEVDPNTGDTIEVPRRPPVLWSPDGRNQVVITESDGTTTLTRVDMDGDERGTATVEGYVSHLRWSPESDRVVFTLGRSASGGGVLQDLWLWDLGDEPPTQITATGAAFGAEWKGSRVRWREDPGEA